MISLTRNNLPGKQPITHDATDVLYFATFQVVKKFILHYIVGVEGEEIWNSVPLNGYPDSTGKKLKIKEEKMADQADVYVKNNLTDEIQAIRYLIPSGNSDLNLSITSGNQEKVGLVRTETSLTIEAPSGVDPAVCPFSVSNEELLSWETNSDHWAVEIKPNNLPPNTPTSVNVEVGETEI